MLTPWRAVGFPSEPWEQSAATPQALLQRVRDVVAAQLEEPDASVLPTRMESQSADSVTAVDRRERCRRGVADGGLCA